MLCRADVRSALGKCLESSLNRLDSIWHEIGFSEEEKCQRTKAVFEHVHSLLDDLATEEEECRKKLKESADQHAVDYAKLCKELSVRDKPVSGLFCLCCFLIFINKGIGWRRALDFFLTMLTYFLVALFGR